MTKSKLDSFFDAADKIADGVVNTLKDVHYPGKDDEDERSGIPDAEVVSSIANYSIGYVTGPDGRGQYHHVFRAQSTYTICDVNLPGRVSSTVYTKSLPTTGFLGSVCITCLRRLIALEAQSKPKELTSGK